MKPPRRLKNGHLRRWPFDTMGIYEEWSAVLTPREAQSARNCAYLHARRTGKQFVTERFPNGRRVTLFVERVA